MKILVAGGGTAGHISPVLAVIASIRKLDKNAEILFVCSGKPNELSLLNESGINYRVIPSGKYRRYGRGFFAEAIDLRTQAKNIKDIGMVFRGYSYSKKIIKEFKPDVVFIKGGYVGLPVGLAAKKLKVAVVVHESDIVMGKANLRLASSAKYVAVSFPNANFPDIRPNKLVFTGNPVRSEFYPASDSTNNTKSKQKPNILIFAGSQGAEAINENIFENVEILAKNFNILHITGEQGIELARVVRHRMPSDLQKFYEPVDFLSKDMIAAYKWADIVVARGGMNSLCELSALSRPAVIIPLPSSTNSHQLKNAEYFSKQGAIRLFNQSELNGLALVNEISKLTEDSKAMQYLSQSIHKLFMPSAATDLARLIIRAGGGEGS